MQINIPDPGQAKEAIDQMQVKPQYFWVTGMVLSVLTFFGPWSSCTGLGIAAAGAFIAAAMVQSTIMAAFLNRPPGPPVAPDATAASELATPPSPPPSPATDTGTPPPSATNSPRPPDHSFAPPESIDLEPPTTPKVNP